ncbi:glycerophosphoryl diester phosphodiesterase [Lactobacillus selangorensis]|uniref:Glycerophosphoryl diester phosphodiesterase n=1 Tax=Lactobacillus selangorensis TaxID=81857 RepID=A0A0R2FF97_9LACO|nr:glycerophosphodiester phosphodiesterase family protein [Lactobacillus selangorensis]KRN27279.1 glycerophosphoryl diester phosphodiesterase [Lactobacillus selangorensis]KRN29938.1 glycerophosphoryl diester phosphodiesterase [Lactobacillus selangorensis]
MTTAIFGHRGYPARFPENSLEGFEYACQHGIDGIETDVQMSADGRLVIMHDEAVDRTTNGTGRIVDMTYEQLRQLRLANDEPLPSLAEALTIFSQYDVLVNLEFKTGLVRYPGIEALTQKYVVQFHLEKQVIYSSFNPESLKTIRLLAPQMKTAWLISRIPAEMTPPAPLEAVHVEHYEPQLNEPQRIWTVDDPLQMRQLFAAPHVAGIITDRFEEAQAMRKLVK